jgi:hypothetical protein
MSPVPRRVTVSVVSGASRPFTRPRGPRYIALYSRHFVDSDANSFVNSILNVVVGPAAPKGAPVHPLSPLEKVSPLPKWKPAPVEGDLI